MSIPKLTFTKSWRTDQGLDYFSRTEYSESQVRADMQDLHDQTKNALNAAIDVLESTGGADAIGATDYSGNSSTVQEALNLMCNDYNVKINAVEVQKSPKLIDSFRNLLRRLGVTVRDGDDLTLEEIADYAQEAAKNTEDLKTRTGVTSDNVGDVLLERAMQIGDVLTTAREDLGADWALCDGTELTDDSKPIYGLMEKKFPYHQKALPITTNYLVGDYYVQNLSTSSTIYNKNDGTQITGVNLCPMTSASFLGRMKAGDLQRYVVGGSSSSNLYPTIYYRDALDSSKWTQTGALPSTSYSPIQKVLCVNGGAGGYAAVGWFSSGYSITLYTTSSLLSGNWARSTIGATSDGFRDAYAIGASVYIDTASDKVFKSDGTQVSGYTYVCKTPNDHVFARTSDGYIVHGTEDDFVNGTMKDAMLDSDTRLQSAMTTCVGYAHGWYMFMPEGGKRYISRDPSVSWSLATCEITKAADYLSDGSDCFPKGSAQRSVVALPDDTGSGSLSSYIRIGEEVTT